MAATKLKLKKALKIQEDSTICPVVAIETSAVSLNELEKFFNYMPANCDVAFVIIMDFDSQHFGVMPDLIERYTDMPVVLIKNGLRVQPNTIYSR